MDRDGSEPPGTVPTIARLKKRADFLRAGQGRRWHGKAFSLHAGVSDDKADPQGDGGSKVRIGFTVTKKVGGSVIRNRARRRLREAVRLAADLPVRPGHDYVLVARVEALRVSFSALRDELERSLRFVQAEGRPRARAERTRPRP